MFTWFYMHLLIHWLTDSLNSCTESLIHWLNDSLFHWFIGSLFRWLIGSFGQMCMDSSCHFIGISTTICSFVNGPNNFSKSLLLHRKKSYRPLISYYHFIFSKLPPQRPGTTWYGLNFVWTPLSSEIFKNCNAWCDFIGYLQSLRLMIFWDCKLRGSVVGWTMIRRPDYGQFFQISMRSVKISMAIVSEMFLMIIQDVEVQDEPE